MFYYDKHGRLCYMSDYLVHERNHKYIAKMQTGRGTRYFYSQSELDAFNKLKKGVKGEIAGIKRFYKASQGKGNVFYTSDGKGYRKAKLKGNRVISMGKEKKARLIERGMLAAWRFLHPGE